MIEREKSRPWAPGTGLDWTGLDDWTTDTWISNFVSWGLLEGRGNIWAKIEKWANSYIWACESARWLGGALVGSQPSPPFAWCDGRVCVVFLFLNIVG